MTLMDFSFFNPSPNFREMSLLRALSQNPDISQGILAKSAGIVPSMVNRYISEFEKEGVITKEGENRRTMSYALTEEGKFRLQFLTISFLNEVANLYSQSHEMFVEVLTSLKEKGINRLYLYGAGIIGGIVAEVLRLEEYEILGFVDDSALKCGEKFHDLGIYSPESIKGADYDGIIVSSFKHSGKMVENAQKHGLKKLFVFKIDEQGQVTLKDVEEIG